MFLAAMQRHRHTQPACLRRTRFEASALDDSGSMTLRWGEPLDLLALPDRLLFVQVRLWYWELDLEGHADLQVSVNGWFKTPQDPALEVIGPQLAQASLAAAVTRGATAPCVLSVPLRPPLPRHVCLYLTFVQAKRTGTHIVELDAEICSHGTPPCHADRFAARYDLGLDLPSMGLASRGPARGDVTLYRKVSDTGALNEPR